MSKELNKVPVEQAGGDERAAQWHECTCPKIGEKWNPAKHGKDCPVHQARAALAQPSQAPADEKPGDSILCSGCFAKGVGPEHFDEAGKCLVRQQTEPLGAEFAQVLSDNLPELLSTAQVKQAEAERPEVVAVARIIRNDTPQAFMAAIPVFDTKGPFEEGETLMKVAQHERIVGALRAELETERMRLAGCGVAALGYFDGCADAYKSASLSDVLRLRADCDAALAKLAELEKQEPVDVPGPDEIHQMAFEEGQPAEDGDGYLFSAEEFDLFVQRLLDSCATPVAQAQQLHDLDKQCRDDVARALGLRPSQERGFAWSYLLASIKSCVKASEDAAQAQHSVPELDQSRSALTEAQMRRIYENSTEAENERLGFAAFARLMRRAEAVHQIAAAPGKEVGHE